jgi:DNA polymerase epsilon subunit 1
MGKRGGGRGGSNTRYTGRRGGPRRTGGNANEGNAGDVVLDRTDDGTAAQERYEEVAAMDEVDEKLGFWRFDSGKVDGEEKIGWLVNMHQARLRFERLALQLISLRRHYSNPKPMLEDSPRSTTTSSKTTEACSRQQ